MSTSPDPAASGRLVVHPSAEAVGISRRRILIIDSHLALVQFSFGKLDCTLPAGLYRVRVESDYDPFEAPAIILPGRTVELEYPDTPAHLLCSPAPVPGSTNGHAALREPLAEVIARHDSGERIYVMVTRDAAERSLPALSWDGWSVLLNGKKGVPLANAETKIDPNNRWAIATLPGSPGGHVLQWTDAAAGLVRQSLWLPAGWVMLVFFSDQGASATPIPHKLSVHLCPVDRNFVHDERGGQIEAAMRSLRDGRLYLPEEEVEAELFGTKFEDPWLGIVLAHLVLQRKKKELPEAVLEHLETLAPGHPDVAALRALIGVGVRAAVTWPPMIQRGLEALRAADWSSEAIASRTLPDTIRSQTLAGTFWTRWPAPTPTRPRRPRSARPKQKGISAAVALTDWTKNLDEIARSAIEEAESSKRTSAARRPHGPTEALVSQVKNYLELYQSINGRLPDAQELAWAGLKETQLTRLLRLGRAVRRRKTAVSAPAAKPTEMPAEEKITPSATLAAMIGTEPVTHEELKTKLRAYLLQLGAKKRRSSRMDELLNKTLGTTPLNKMNLDAFLRRQEWRTGDHA